MSGVLSGQMTQWRPRKVTLSLVDATPCVPSQAPADREVPGRACPVRVRTSGGAALSPPVRPGQNGTRD